MDTAKKRHSYGFTLMEMLVVIAILFVLIGLVFAVLAPARQKARETSCVSQMRQHAKALHMYYADWDGIEPVKGGNMTPAQVGMPPISNLRPILKQYGTFSIVACPNRHDKPPKGFNHVPFVSYQITGWCWYDDPSLVDRSTEMLTSKGTEFPLISCDQHNDNVDFDNQPHWAKKRILLIRYNQSLQRIEVPASDTNSSMY